MHACGRYQPESEAGVSLVYLKAACNIWQPAGSGARMYFITLFDWGLHIYAWVNLSFGCVDAALQELGRQGAIVACNRLCGLESN